MASIIGEKRYYNATDVNSGGWAVSDKIFGYLDKAGDIYNKIRYPQPGDPDYLADEARLRAERAGLFGLPKPWGALLLVGGIGLLGFGIWKLAK